MTAAEQLELGAALRDVGTSYAWAAESEAWKEAAERGLDYLIRRGTTFTADALRELVGDPPGPNSLGALFRAAAQQGRIERVGFQPATRPERHAAIQSIWRAA